MKLEVVFWFFFFFSAQNIQNQKLQSNLILHLDVSEGYVPVLL